MAVPKKIAETGLMSTGDVARDTGYHRGTVWSWIKRGMLAATKVGERYVGVSPESLATFRKTYRLPTVSPDKPAASKKRARKRAKPTR